MNAQKRMDVELYGGPLDGFQTDVPVRSAEFDVSLFTLEEEGCPKKVWAYAFAGSMTAEGERWRLQFLYEVARVGISKKGDMAS